MTNKLFTELRNSGKLFEVLYVWRAPERHWYPKDRSWYIIYSFFFILIIALLAILNEFILIILIIAFVFLWFTQGAIPPDIAEHQITTLGIKSFGKVYKWRNIKHYWFSIKSGVYVLHIELMDEEFTTNGRLHRMSFILNEEDLDPIFYLMIDFVDYGDTDEIGYNFMDKFIHGKHIDISDFLEEISQEDYLDSKGVEKESYNPEIEEKTFVQSKKKKDSKKSKKKLKEK